MLVRVEHLKDDLVTMTSYAGERFASGPQRMADFTVGRIDDAVDRIDHLAHPVPGYPRILDLGRPGQRVRHVADTWDASLGLRQPILSSPTDLRSRTDPRDDRPVESWGSRILRRLGL